jgi:hypothetical protein
VPAGSAVIADVTVNQIPADRAMIGYDVSAQYDANLFEVIAVDYNFLLGAVGTYTPLVAFSDQLPDSDGSVRVSIIDTAVDVANNENIESGPGVLFRMTLRPKTTGVGDLRIRFEPPDHYPQILDKTNSVIQVDQVAVTRMAVGQACPANQPEPEIVPLPPLEEIYGTPVAPAGSATPIPPDVSGGPGQEEEPTPPGASPGADTPAPTDASSTPAASPSPSPAALPTAGDDSDTGAIIVSVLFAVLGLSLCGAGGWILYQRTQAV